MFYVYCGELCKTKFTTQINLHHTVKSWFCVSFHLQLILNFPLMLCSNLTAEISGFNGKLSSCNSIHVVASSAHNCITWLNTHHSQRKCTSKSSYASGFFFINSKSDSTISFTKSLNVTLGFQPNFSRALLGSPKSRSTSVGRKYFGFTFTLIIPVSFS